MLYKKLTCLFLNWWELPTHPRKLDQLKVTLWFSLHLGWRQICLGYQVGYDMFLNGFFYKLILWSLLPSPVCPERTWPSWNQKWHILWIWNPITRTALWRLLPLDRMNFGLPQICIVTYCCWKTLLIQPLRYANSRIYKLFRLLIPFSLQEVLMLGLRQSSSMYLQCYHKISIWFSR